MIVVKSRYLTVIFGTDVSIWRHVYCISPFFTLIPRLLFLVSYSSFLVSYSSSLVPYSLFFLLSKERFVIGERVLIEVLFIFDDRFRVSGSGFERHLMFDG